MLHGSCVICIEAGYIGTHSDLVGWEGDALLSLATAHAYNLYELASRPTIFFLSLVTALAISSPDAAILWGIRSPFWHTDKILFVLLSFHQVPGPKDTSGYVSLLRHIGTDLLSERLW